MKMSFIKRVIKNGMMTTETDVRQYLHFLIYLSLLLIFVGSFILVDEHVHHQLADTNFNTFQLYQNKENGHLFHHAIGFSLVISLPTLIDIVSCLFSSSLQFTWSDLLQTIEFTRNYIVAILLIPNVFIYWHVIPSIIIDLVIFYQYICLLFVFIYRIQTLSIGGIVQQQIHATTKRLRDMFVISNITILVAFGFKLSSYSLLPSRLIWKGLYITFLLLLHIIAILKIKPWSYWKMIHNPLLLQSNKATLYVVMACITTCTILTLVHVVTLAYDYVFFPHNLISYIIIEWFYGFVLLSWTSLRIYDMRKSELTTLNQLISNRKMTRSISHEIRTPLNTAFMALDLLISSLKQPQPPQPQQQEQIHGNVSTTIPIQSTTTQSANSTNELLEIAENIKQGCDIALNILNQLLTYDKLNAGMLQLENKQLTISQLLESNMKLFTMHAQQCSITFLLDRCNVGMDELYVYVDEHKICQVIRNLLSNAMKFTPKGGSVVIRVQWVHLEEREILINRLIRKRSPSAYSEEIEWLFHHDRPSVPSTPLNASGSVLSQREEQQASNGNKAAAATSAALASAKVPPKPVVNLLSNIPTHQTVCGLKENGTLLISIVDSGPGVSEEDQKKLFQEYVQINPGELQKGQGTGLGLSISKSIVQLHGGNVGMTSEGKGKGSTFYVELPAYSLAPINTNLADDVISSIYHSIRRDASRLLSVSPRDGDSGHVPSTHSHCVHPSVPTSSASDTDRYGYTAMYQLIRNILSGGHRDSDIEHGIVPQPRGSRPNSSRVNRTIRSEAGHSTRKAIPGTRYPTAGNPTQTKVTPLPNTLDSMIQKNEKDESGPMPSEAIGKVLSNEETVPPSSTVDSMSLNITKHMIPLRCDSNDTMSGKSYRILLVDDSIPNRKMLNRLLTREHHIVTEAQDGTEAIEIVRKSLEHDPNNEQTTSEFDLILMDYYMPGMNGPDAIAAIRDMGYTGVIFGVSGVMDDDANHFIEAGAHLVLYKPITMAALWKALRGISSLS